VNEPAPAGSSGSPTAAVLEGMLRGFAAAAIMAALTEAMAVGAYLATGRPFRLWTFAKIGWLYLLAFHRVGVRVGLGGVPGAGGSGSILVGAVYTIHAALLTGTVLAGFLLVDAGRRVASEARPRTLGAAIAIGYAAPIAIGSRAAVVRLPEATIRPVAWEAIAFPLAFAAAAVAIGIVSSRSGERPFERAIAGGCRMLWWSLALTFVGFLVVAGARPDASGAYAGYLRREGGLGAVIAAHHLLAVPDQSVAMLAVAMGSCDGVYGPHGGWDLACQGRLVGPAAFADVGVLARAAPSLGSIGVGVGEAPWWWWLFAIAPAVATVAAGRRAARGRRHVLTAIGAGGVFAALVWVASWAASVSVGISVGTSPEGTIRLGPSLPRTATLALAWGVAGGVLGALSARRVADDQTAGGEPPTEDPPPSPTSE
jgi:hypothetical protein